MKLRAQSIAIAAPRELCFEVVAAAGKRLEKRSEEEWVVEFVTEVGGRTVRTVELLTLDRPRSIRYEWLEGPLRKVDEAMGFMPTDEGTLVTYGGSFSIGMGPVGWVIGLLRVKPLFDRLVEEHLEQAKEIAEKRAARSKVHGKQPSSGDGTDGVTGSGSHTGPKLEPRQRRLESLLVGRTPDVARSAPQVDGVFEPP